jgi:release factor glutamine methyltransferase
VHTDPDSIRRALAAAGCIAAAEEAAELIAAAGDDPAVLAELVTRRTAGEPLAWLIGRIEFCGIAIAVEPGVYVPRWQSEPLARRAVELLPAGGTAVDLCTGSGAIAAVLAAADPSARVIGTELDEAAARCARRNGVDVRIGDLGEPLPGEIVGAIDVITAVVPYVPSEELQLLPRDVREHEPRLALDGGAGGTGVLLEVVRRSPRLLKRGGHLLLELGGDQPEPVRRALRAGGFGAIEVMRDAEGDARGVSARLGDYT